MYFYIDQIKYLLNHINKPKKLVDILAAVFLWHFHILISKIHIPFCNNTRFFCTIKYKIIRFRCKHGGGPDARGGRSSRAVPGAFRQVGQIHCDGHRESGGGQY